MAKLKIMSLELVAPKSRKEAIVDYLQQRGAVELSVPPKTDGMSFSDFTEKTAEAQRLSVQVKSALELLNRMAPVKKPLTAMLEPRRDISAGQYKEESAHIEETLAACREILSLNRQNQDLTADNVRQNALIAQLEPWQNIDIPLLSGFTKKTAYILGSIRERLTREDILSLLAKELPERDCVDVRLSFSDDTQTCFAVFCLKEDSEEIETVLRNVGFMRAPDCPERSPQEEINRLKAVIDGNEKQIEKNTAQISAMADRREKIEFALDYLSISGDKFSAFGKLEETGRVFFLKAYVAQKDAQRICDYCEKNFDAATQLTPPAPGEDVPVLLSNNFFAAPLEGITGMYSMPSERDIDPTGIMAFFYYFFFGMMLSDAGYGLIMVLLTGGLLLFKKGMEAKTKNMLKMWLFCGMSTVFWGAMYGSWFGDAAKVICTEFLGKPGVNPLSPIWTDPVGDLMNVLVVCFIFGLVHLFVGVALKSVTDWKNGKKLAAFTDSVPTYLTILGIAPIFFNLFTEVPEVLSKIATPVLIVGLVLVVATGGSSSKSIAGKIGGGLYEVYNLIGGYLGDVLSYARLLALGLATGVIAQVMNMLGTLPQSRPVKTVLFIIVFIVGHIANLGINVIGAYVHTNRLQYVEFFGKFYEGGGRAFVPLAAKTQYYKFKEEN